ncbi:acyl carrier protein [Blautia obeum]|uniref:acyl carrier protein n=1 Tax=Blautia obeum TaxID=40520 RepID=UPI003F8A36E5
MSIEKLISILKSIDEFEDIDIQREHNLKEDLHMNSFSFMMLIVELEDELKQSLEPSIFLEVKTVEDLHNKLMELSGEKE